MAQDFIPRQDNDTDIGSEEFYIDGVFTTTLRFGDTTSMTTVPSAAGGQITEYYTSSVVGLNAVGLSLNELHGFTADPKFVQFAMICTSPDGGYSTGDRVFVNPTAGENLYGVGIWWDDNNVYARVLNTVILLSWTNGGWYAAVPARWNWYVNLFG